MEMGMEMGMEREWCTSVSSLFHYEQLKSTCTSLRHPIARSHPTDSAVIKRALKPLRRMRLGRHSRKTHEIPRQGASALAAHRVALVSHRAGSDLPHHFVLFAPSGARSTRQGGENEGR